MSPITPPLAVAYDVLLGSPNRPAEVVITIRPYSWRTMCGHAARVVWNEPPTCTARWRSRSAGSISGNCAQRMMPALLTRMSMPSNPSSAVGINPTAPQEVEM